MKRSAKAVFLMLLLAVVITCLPVAARAETATENVCGENLTWELDSNGNLTVSGTGPMYDYDPNGNPAPWAGEASSIVTVTIGEGVTTVGSYAFCDCENLAVLTLPDSLTGIGKEAFRNCESLASVTLPAGFTSLGEGAFYNCRGISGIFIPNGVTAIPDNAFYNCQGLKSVNFGSGVQTIGASAFYGCKGIVKLTFPQNLTAIGKYAFEGCTGLNIVVVSENLTSIGASAFYNCTGLTAVYLNNTTLAGKELVHTSNGGLCGNAKMIAVPRGATALGSYITSNYAKTATIHNAGELYDLYTDHTCKWTEGTINKVCSVCSANCYHNLNYVPAEYVEPTCAEKGYTLYTCVCGYTEKGDYVNAAGHSYTNGICTVCDHVRDWEYAVLGGTVTITDYTGTDAVLTIPQKIKGYPVTKIHSKAFYANEALEEVIISEGVKEIGYGAFDECKNLKKVTIPSTLEKVGEYAFDGNKIEDVYISDLIAWLNIDFELEWGPVEIAGFPDITSSPMAFAENLYLNGEIVTDVVIPESITEISPVAFAGWTKLKSVTLHDGVTYIGAAAFYRTGITQITIPDSVRTIGWGAFTRCDALEDVYISDLAKWCTIEFSTDYIYPWMTAVGTNPLYCAENLYVNGELITQLVIPEGVTTISEGAFCGFDTLTRVAIPKSVTSIGHAAFLQCTSLKDIYYDGTATDWQKIEIGYSLNSTIEQASRQYHTHNTYYHSAEVTAPTCTEQGYTNYSCSCGNSFRQVNAPATGHSYVEGICTVCGEKAPEGGQPDAPQISIQKGYDGNFYYFVNGLFDGSYTGIAEYNADRWYVRNGQVIFSANGLIAVDSGSYYVKGGRVERCTGLKKLEGQWLYFLDGRNDTDYAGLVLHNGMLAYVENGAVNFNKTDMVMYQGKGYYVKYGIWVESFTGLIKSSDKVWRYIEKGVFNDAYEGAAKNSAGWWGVRNGVIDPGFTGLVKHNGSEYYAKYGQIMFSTTGILEIGGSSCYIKGGMFQSSYTGLITVDTGCWYIRDGKVDYQFNGDVDVKGVTYTVVNGFATVK